MGNKNLTPRISVNLNENCLYIGKDTIRQLGCPSFVCILQNYDQNRIAITPCEEKLVTSFKVPDGFPAVKSKKFRIHSSAYVESIVERAPWMTQSSNVLLGKYDEDHNAVVFELAAPEE